MRRTTRLLPIVAITIAATVSSGAQTSNDGRLEALRKEISATIDGRAKMAQEMVDSVFSFGELGFQELETSRYLTAILEKNGFKIERGIAGIPTAWAARWGAGRPVISLGSDIDGIPQASQKPGVAYHDPLIPGAPGHGEGHNSGQAVNIAAALAVKAIMERENIKGTLKIWPVSPRSCSAPRRGTSGAGSSGTSMSRSSRTSPTTCRRRGARRRATVSCPSSGGSAASRRTVRTLRRDSARSMRCS
jgi:hypothetical protein